MKVLFTLIFLLSLQAAYGNSLTDHYVSKLHEEAETFVSCESFEKMRPLCERLHTARKRVSAVTLSVFNQREGAQVVP